MKKNIFIFTVSIMAVLGVCPMARADIPSMEWLVLSAEAKLDKVQDAELHDNALVIAKDGEVVPSKIDENHLAESIMNKINSAMTQVDTKTVIEDKAIVVAKLDGGTDAANSRVLTVDSDGSVSAQLPSIPVGQDGTSGAAQIWIQEQ